MSVNIDMITYSDLLRDIKSRIRLAQIKATLSANSEMILMYWDIGRMVFEKQRREGWGAAVIPRLSLDIQNDLPEEKGFSKRNIGRMIAFYKEYCSDKVLPQPVSQLSSMELPKNLQQYVANIPWGHNIMLMEKIKDLSSRFYDRLYQLDDTRLSVELKAALNLSLDKLRGMAYQKMKLLK